MESARIWEETVIIPTYEVGEADKNPMFLEKRVYQGSSGKIYPYPATSDISLTPTDHAWRAIWLENQYLKVMILPELGGRIQRATDKTNGYDFVYYNHVIKPALVGLLGPWISGGIEFNWPQHHRPTTYMPVDYELEENADGSVTLLTSDVDQMYGTKEVTGFTLYPDKAYIEIRGQLYNRTSLPQTFLWWANPAVAVNDHTQSVFPPDVHTVYDHGKRAVSRFPVATGEYYKHDYSEGVDISRYRNIPVPTSYMAERSSYDFVGGYDYGVEGGLLHVADHHVSPGKKQWTWGCGDFGKAWDRNLTDTDGPYIELMTGMYCDNQPDFAWLAPFEEKVFKQYFMPYKKLGQVKNATIDAAISVEPLKDGQSVTEDKAAQGCDGLCIRVYATAEYQDAVLTIKEVPAKGGAQKELYRETVTLSPVLIYEKDITVACDSIYDIHVAVMAGGRELVSYQPQDQGIPVLAEPARAPALPEQTRTMEELYLTARHIEQYRHATWLPDPYYLEGLKRDPEDARINNAYGMLLMRRGLFTDAEKHFRTAIRRLTGNGMFNNPYDGEPFYNLGLSLFCQGDDDSAYDAFYKATWTDAEQEKAYYYLSAIAARKGDFSGALAFADRALVKNSHNIKARGLKAMLLYRLSRTEEAGKQAEDNLCLDAFDWVSRYVRLVISGRKDAKDIRSFCDRVQLHKLYETVLLSARDMAEAGFYEEALGVLALCKEERPLLHYYRAYYLTCLHREAEAAEARRHAEACDPAYTFPNKPEDQIVLESAIGKNPDDGHARYYLGNLLYDRLRFDEAIAEWTRATELLPDYPTVFRNLAIALYNKKGDATKALAYMEKAFSLNRQDARVLLELDQLCHILGRTPQERLTLLGQFPALVQTRDDLYAEYITCLNLCGRYEEAHEAITGHTFRTWEGAEGKITTQFKVCLLELARKAFARNDTDRALQYLEEALSYPENLGEGRLEGTKDNNIYYQMGLVLEQVGQETRARECFEKATLGAQEVAGVLYYYDQPADMILYQGLSFRKLGQQKAANARFYRLLDYGEQHLTDEYTNDYFAVSMPDMSVFDADMTSKIRVHCHYLMGLGHLGLGDMTAAARDFSEALRLDPNHQNAGIYHAMCEGKEE